MGFDTWISYEGISANDPDLGSEFIPRAIQPGNCLPHSYKTHEPPNDSKIGVEQPYNYFNTIKTY